MKRLICLVMALVLLCGVSVALGEAKQIDFKTKRNIKIHSAGLNTDPNEMIQQGISPTTGRKLDELEIPNGFSGTVVTGLYQPTMVQVSNSSNGFNDEDGIKKGGDIFRMAPIYGNYADVVYEVAQTSNGSSTRMTMLFCDTIPTVVGFIRSTRFTHVKLLKEWNCNLISSGYPTYMDTQEFWNSYKISNPLGPNRITDPGPVYIGGVDGGRPWRKFYGEITDLSGAGSHRKIFFVADLVNDVVPKDKVYTNHTWLFADELPEGGDDATFIDVKFGQTYDTNSVLQYNEDDRLYYRVVNVRQNGEQIYRSSTVNVTDIKRESARDGYAYVTANRELGEPITFTNVIVQGIETKWPGSEIPDPQLVGSGNADYFMGGKHYEGVWERKDIDSRTVYYDANGNELQLQRGKTLIILMNYNSDHTGVSYE